LNYEYHPTSDVDFDSIDWVSVCEAIGIKVRQPKMPVLLRILTDDERLSRALKLINILINMDKVPKDYVRDSLYDEVMDYKITSLDRAWIVYLTNKLMERQDIH
jgi:hypothetical protein